MLSATAPQHFPEICCSSSFYVSRDKNSACPLQHTPALVSIGLAIVFSGHRCDSKTTVLSPSLAILPLVPEILAVLEDQEVRLAPCLLEVHGDPSDLDDLCDQVSQVHLEGPFLPEDLFHLWCQVLPKWKKMTLPPQNKRQTSDFQEQRNTNSWAGKVTQYNTWCVTNDPQIITDREWLKRGLWGWEAWESLQAMLPPALSSKQLYFFPCNEITHSIVQPTLSPLEPISPGFPGAPC